MANYDFSSLGSGEATQGTKACINNAKRLIEAANYLSEGNFLELATFTVCTAIEEIGKAFLLLEYQEKKLDGKDKAADNLNAWFDKHFPKLRTALTISELNKQAIGLMVNSIFRTETPESASRYFWKKIDAFKDPNVQGLVTRTLDTRNEMIYTDFKDGRFTSPMDTAQKENLISLVKTSKKLIVQAERDLDKVCAGLKRGSIQDRAIEAIHHEFKKR